MNYYDFIIVGGGVGGLSVGAFLAKEGKQVLILEKHTIPGGYVTSFTRQGCRFDTAIFHLFEMGENQSINQFLHYLGEHINSEKLHYKFKYFIGDKEYNFNGLTAEQELQDLFPSSSTQLASFFDISKKMYNQSRATGPPKPPYEMLLFEKIKFGVESSIKKPTLMKYMLKNGVETLRKIISDTDTQNIIWGYYPAQGLFFWAYAYGWVEMVEDRNYYPEGGMQAIPDALVRALEKHGGEMKLKTEVEEIIIENNQAKGVRCTDGTKYFASNIISNAPINHTLDKLTKGVESLDKLRKRVDKQEIFDSAFFVYMGINSSFEFKGINSFIILEEGITTIPVKNLTPDNCPIMVIVPPQTEDQKEQSVVIATILPYKFKNNWGAGKDKERGEEYKKVKEEAKNKLLERVYAKLGKEFQEAVKFSIAATPITFERYTYNKEGSIMGWQVDKNYYKYILPHRTAVKNFFLVGQWVFPGFGVPGVLVSGYYLAKKILEKEGIDLEQKFKDFFNNESS